VTVDYREFYRGRAVMITGGLGFIGSNLARALVNRGADVLLVYSLIPDYGGNHFSSVGNADRVRVNVADIRQQTTMNYLVRDRDVIFSLAGQVSHIDSMRDPYTDLDINCRSQLTVLEACRNHNPRVKVVFAGTRQVYGKPDSLPVSEHHLVRPTDVNGINKAAGENYHLVYNNVFGVRGCSLRLTNVYGPRQLIRHNRQGFIGWFIRLAIEDREIQVFGDGSQMRDFVFVDGGLTMYNNPAFQLFLMATLDVYGLGWTASEQDLLLVSVGTGTSPQAKEDLQPGDMNLLFNASSVPSALMYAALVEQDLLCRVFGRFRHGAVIDREVGDLQTGRGVLEQRMFTYLRSNAELTRAGLDKLGLPDVRPEDVQRLDSIDHIGDLQRVGARTALDVAPKHFAGFLGL